MKESKIQLAEFIQKDGFKLNLYLSYLFSNCKNVRVNGLRDGRRKPL